MTVHKNMWWHWEEKKVYLYYPLCTLMARYRVNFSLPYEV